MSRNRIIIAIALVLVTITCAVAIWWTRPTTVKFAGPTEKLALGVFPSVFSLFIWVAEAKDFFKKNGLELAITEYDSGVSAVKNLMDGKVEIATAADSVLVSNISNAPDLRILATIDAVDDIRLIGRKDHGINQLSDLKGKKIGLMRKSPAEFFLDRLLMMEGMSSADVMIINLSPSRQLESITRGELDAVLVWQPYNHKILHALGTNAFNLSAQSKQDFYWLLISKDEFIRTRSDTIRRFLSALLMAEDFVKENETESKKIAMKRLGYDMPYLESIWKNNKFNVSLPQGLLLTMEDQTRWMVSSQLTGNTEIPDFLDVVYTQGLETLKPEAVSMIH